jgi:hypothetical protein
VLNPPAVDKVPYRLSMTLKLNMPSKITKISSPSHPLEVSYQQTMQFIKINFWQNLIEFIDKLSLFLCYGLGFYGRNQSDSDIWYWS